MTDSQRKDGAPMREASLDGREEFEKWMRVKGCCDDDFRLRDDRLNDYRHSYVQQQWEAWQASRSSERERVAELERFRERAYLNHTENTSHTTGCLIWGEDGQGAVPEAWEKAYKAGLPCSCGALVNFERRRAESAESRVEQLQRMLKKSERIMTRLAAALRSHIEGK